MPNRLFRAQEVSRESLLSFPEIGTTGKLAGMGSLKTDKEHEEGGRPRTGRDHQGGKNEENTSLKPTMGGMPTPLWLVECATDRDSEGTNTEAGRQERSRRAWCLGSQGDMRLKRWREGFF